MAIKVRRLKRRRRTRGGFKHLIVVLTIILILIFSGLIFMPTQGYKECFRTLSDMQRYAKKTNENTPIENNDTTRPEFTKYYQSQTPSFLKKIENKVIWILSKIKLIKTPSWDISAFKILIEELGSTRQQAGMKDNFVFKIQTQPNAKIVIFGNLQGSFHSFVRCLTKLKELGIIDETLKITQPQNYILWMGDVIDRSPFTLETLSAVMRMLQTNQNNAIYLRGNHETNNYWQEHTLKNELQIRAAGLSISAIPLEMEINRLFNTLPLAAYLTTNEPNEFVRISDAGRETLPILNEANYADSLIKKSDANSTFFAIKENADVSSTTVKIKAIIRGEKKRKTFQKNEGLRLLPPDLDSVAWNVLSCPNIVYQKALDFYSDAFAIITTAEKLSNWEISLYTRDVRTKDPFKEIKYNLISGLDLETNKKMATTSATSSQSTSQQQIPQPSVATTQAQAPIKTQPSQQPQTPSVQAQPSPQAQVVTQPQPPKEQIQNKEPATSQPAQVTQNQPQLMQIIPETENQKNQTQPLPQKQQDQPNNLTQ